MNKDRVVKSFNEIILEYDDLQLDKPEMVALDNPVYQLIADRIQVKKKETVYLRIKRYKQNFLFKTEKILLKPVLQSDQDEEREDVLNSSDGFENSVSVELTNIQSAKLKIIEKMYESKGRKRIYHILSPGWTDVLAEICWLNFKIQCALSFKNMKQNAGFHVTGNCSECDLQCTVESYDLKTLYIAIKKGDATVDHLKKRFVTGEKRKFISEKLQNNTAKVLRNKMAVELMEDEDVEPAIIPNSGKIKNITLTVQNNRIPLENRLVDC